jgi:uncharacterized membrane protein
MVDGIVNFLHLLATIIWLGGTISIHFLLTPALAALEPQQAGKATGVVFKRFPLIAWACILTLLVTGTLKTPHDLFFDPSSTMGLILMVKHLFIAGVITVGLLIAFAVVPRLRAAAPKPGDPPSAEFFRQQKRLRFLTTMNMTLGILIVACASQLW